MTTQTLNWTNLGPTITDDTGTSVAQLLDTDPLVLAYRCLKEKTYPLPQTLILPCGSHSPTDPEPSQDLLKQWAQTSWEPFNTAIATLKKHVKTTNTQLIILPGAGGRLSDAICTLSWAAAHPDIPLLIDPIRWLTPSMMPDLTDHLIRSASLCEELPNIWGVVVRSIQSDNAGNLSHAPIGEGLISNELLDRTIRTIPTPRWIGCHYSPSSAQ